MRPSNGRSLLLTSGSIGAGAYRGRSRRSTGISKMENAEMACGLPSSKISKSSCSRSRTNWPSRSVTTASTSTYSTLTLKVGVCGAGGAAGPGDGAFWPAPGAPVRPNMTPRKTTRRARCFMILLLRRGWIDYSLAVQALAVTNLSRFRCRRAGYTCCQCPLAAVCRVWPRRSRWYVAKPIVTARSRSLMSRRRHLTSKPCRRRCGPTAIDGWLLYDFRGSEPHRGRSGGGQPAGRTSGDAPLVLPDSRDRRAPGARSCHRAQLARAPSRHHRAVCAAAISSKPGSASSCRGCGASPWSIRPTVRSRTCRASTPGTIELVRAAGVEVVSSGDLIQRFASVWDAGRDRHPSGRVRKAPPGQGRGVRRDRADAPTTACRRRSTTSSSSWPDGSATRGSSPTRTRTCRRRKTPATRITCPRRRPSRTIRADELVLLDLWGKLDRPGAVFADITWMGYTGRQAPDRYAEAFAAVAGGARCRHRARPARGARGAGAARVAGGPRGGVRAAERRLRRSHPAPDGAQPRRIGSRQRRQHGRLRDARRPAAARRHRLHDRAGRLLRRFRRPVGNQHDRRPARREVTGPVQTGNRRSRVGETRQCPLARPR